MTKVDDKREAILEATLKLVSEHGFHGTAMSKVAKEAGVSAGIIYHYFKNKDELLKELYLEIKQRSLKAQMAGHDPELPIRIQIRQLWGEMIRYFIQHPEETTYINQFATSPYYTEAVERQGLAYYAAVMECFDRAKQEMIIKDMPMPIYATFVADVPSALVRRQAAGQFEITPEVEETVIEALWQAIRM